MVSALASQSLLSGRKFTKAGYVTIYDGDEVNIFNGCTTKITVSEAQAHWIAKCNPT